MEDKEIFKPKLRVTTLRENGSIIQDRLVDATIEMNNGPREKHTGPVRIEVTLTNKTDVENFKTYLDRLQGDLPIKGTSNGRGRPAAAPKELQTPREDILNDIEQMVKDGKNQDEVIKYLRNLGFVFILTEDFLSYFSEFDFNKKDIGEPTNNHQFPESLSWMVRRIKKGKDPKTDKFDPMIIFGFSIQSGPSRKVVPYLYKERKKPLRIATGKKLTFNTVEFTKMPKWMLEDERLKFSSEQRALILNPDKKPSKFFLRWASDVKVPQNIYEQLKDRVPQLGSL
jgi:hypothetical protein